jgi:hypothetical protein
MQPVNGVERVAGTGSGAIPAMENPNDPITLPPELIAKLREPLPPEAVSPNPQKPGLSVIKVIYVVERLNEVFGLNGWRVVNDVVENGRMVVVKAGLKVPKYNIHIEQYGGNDNPDRGDAYKGACTDALSKCASYLGIGMDVYKGLHDDRVRTGSTAAVNGSRAATAFGPEERSPLARTQARNGEPTGLTSILSPWIEEIRNSRFNQNGRLFVIVGRATFSAAMEATNHLHDRTAAIFVGEPTGAKPQFQLRQGDLPLPKTALG